MIMFSQLPPHARGRKEVGGAFLRDLRDLRGKHRLFFSVAAPAALSLSW
jgi:hypothetical protein